MKILSLRIEAGSQVKDMYFLISDDTDPKIYPFPTEIPGLEITRRKIADAPVMSEILESDALRLVAQQSKTTISYAPGKFSDV